MSIFVLPIEDISPSETNTLKTKLRQILKHHFDEFFSKPENQGKHATFFVDYQIFNLKVQDEMEEVVYGKFNYNGSNVF